MKTILISRIFGSGNVTLSYLKVYDEQMKLVLERKAVELPWKDNKRKMSCIPAGEYEGIGINRPSNGKYAIHLQRVPKRTAILIHAANRANQLLGCIAPGKRFIDLNNDGVTDVTSSTDVMIELEALIPLKSHCKIKIVDTWRAIGNLDPKDEKRV